VCECECAFVTNYTQCNFIGRKATLLGTGAAGWHNMDTCEGRHIRDSKGLTDDRKDKTIKLFTHQHCLCTGQGSEGTTYPTDVQCDEQLAAVARLATRQLVIPTTHGATMVLIRYG